jgi:hypothetical protein
MIAEILNSFALNLDYLRRLVEDLDDGQMVAQPAGVVNHPAWTIGHLVQSCQAIGGELGIPPWLPDDWGRRFGTGSVPVAIPDAYPGKAALMRALDDGRRRLAEALAEMGEEGLARPLPDVRYRDRLPTIGHAVLHILAAHTALHVGQVATWRRAMGLAIGAEPLNDASSR